MTSAAVTSPLEPLAPLLLWLPALAVLTVVNGSVALLRRPLGRVRWLLAATVALAPLTFPVPSTVTPVGWGILATLTTTLIIASAARLPDLDHVLKISPRTRFELFIWMSFPMARFSLDAQGRSSRKRRALRFLLKAGLKRLAWEPFAYLTTVLDGESIPWPIKSSLVMLYFVFNLTALADLCSALCLALGSDVDELFDAPFLSRSPRDFWSRRWNKFINKFALKQVALPLRRRVPQALVILAVFATSGIFHEYFAWGVGGPEARHGSMSLFFLVQGLAVWLGSKLPLPSLPRLLSIALTFIWMALTAPLFFWAVEPALHAFGFPASWLPF